MNSYWAGFQIDTGVSPKGRRETAEGSPRGDFGGAKAPGTGQPIRADASVRERDEAVGMAGIKCPDKERRGGMGFEVAGKPRHTVEGMARGRKKEKAPQEKKAPNKKRETAACGSACLRAAAPPSTFSRLLWPPLASRCLALASLASYGRLRRPPLLLLSPLPSAASLPPFLAPSALLSPLVGGCAAPPLCVSSRASFGRLRRPTPSASPPLPFRVFGGYAASLSPRALVGGWRRPLSLSSLSNN